MSRKSIWHLPNEEVNFFNGYQDCGGNQQTLVELAQSVAHEGMVGFEVGCYTGTTASWVLPVFKQHNGRYHCIDWFRGSIDTRVGAWNWKDDEFPAPEVLIQTLQNFELLGFLDCVTVTVARGVDIAPIVADGSLDYVYIGADHRYTPFKKDLQDWTPKLRKGGVICGHALSMPDANPKDSNWQELCDLPEEDFYQKFSGHFGITRGLLEVLPEFEHSMEIWWWRK